MIESWIGRLEVLGNESCLRFILALLHFLWQGAVIGAVVAAVAWILRKSSPLSRYALHSVAMISLPICLAVTFTMVDVPNHWRLNTTDDFASLARGNAAVVATDLAPVDSSIDLDGGAQSSGNTERLGQTLLKGDVIEFEGQLLHKRSTVRPLFVRAAPTVVAIYLVGVCLFLLRFTIAAWGGHRLRRISIPIDDPSVQKLVVEQSRRVGLSFVPVVAYCRRAAVPMAVGVLRPVVLLPASIMTGLEPQQFAAIISHELAHVRRYDLLVNLVQRLIESLFFFHPVVWYISRRMSAERELCCDELVVSSGYSPMDYAGALLQMAELCSRARQAGVIAVAASGRKMSLLEVRIQRLIDGSRESRLRLTRAGVVMIALLTCLVAVAPALLRNRAHAQSDEDWKERGREVRDDALVLVNKEASETVEAPPFHWPTRFSGVVKDMDGSPIAGAEVQLTVTEHFREGTDFAKRTIKTARTTADDHGQYVLPVADWPVPSAERPFSVNVVAAAPGYAPWETWLFNRRDVRRVSDSFPELRLPRGKEITGRCVDGNGRPVGGAAIRGLSSLDQSGRWPMQNSSTDRSGHFRLIAPDKHAAAIWVVSDTEGCEHVEIPPNHDGPVQVVMRGGTSLEGRVESLSGKPVAGTLVVLQRKHSMAGYGAMIVLRFAAETDEQGRFRLPPVRGEFKCFLAQASGSSERSDDAPIFAKRAAPPVVPVAVSLDGKGRHNEITLRESRTVQLGGVVRLQDGRPVKGCPIDVCCHNVECGTLASDQDGRYSLTVPATSQVFNIWALSTTNHHVRAAQHAPGKHEGQFIILDGVTEDIANADFVFVSRSEDAEQPAEHPGGVLFWEELARIGKDKERSADDAAKANDFEKGEAPARLTETAHRPQLAAETSVGNADEEVARLQNTWQGWSDAVHSMEVEGYKFLGDFGETGLSRDAVRKLIDETILPGIEPGVTTLDELKSLTDPMFSYRPGTDRSRPLGVWRLFKLVEDADAVRVDEEAGGRKMVTVRKDGREQQYREGAKQASLFTKRTGLRIERIETFLPHYKIARAKDLEWKLQSRTGGEVRCLELANAEGRGIVFEYDGRTGFVRGHTLRLSRGVFYRERIQSRPIATSVGVPLPQVSIDLRYSPTPDGETVTRSMAIHVINRLELNQPVDQKRFLVSVPAGTRIVRFEGGDDHVPPSQGGTRPQITKVDQPVPDVSAYY